MSLLVDAYYAAYHYKSFMFFRQTAGVPCVKCVCFFCKERVYE